ncbi:MAG: response regulator [Candidatus Riflebacteria bacterium]|nr:response regulator [Candidatus Riflebacteria bacterium]
MDTSSKQTILIVDDVPGNLEILSNILSPDYAIKAAKSGKKALEIAQENPALGLILLDVVMPGLNGFETCEILKSDPRTRSIPVIFVSAHNEAVDEERGLEVGGVDYLSKPVNPLIVRARVKTHLALSSATRELILQNRRLQENINLLEQIEQIARHDLKGSLTVFVNASSYMGKDDNLTPQQREYIELIDESAVKMLGMIDRSLDLFKMERGQYRVKPVPVDMVKLVRTVCKELESLARHKNVEYSVLLNGRAPGSSDVCLIQGETILLSTIVSNLVKNAIEASPTGGKVVIALIKQAPFLIEIRNQGVIPAEIKARFLERYATHGKEKGTGLGGYSARLMARTLGGDIKFVSTQESGTVITVSIPHCVTSLHRATECEV